MNFLQGGFLGVDPNSTPKMLNQRRQRLNNVMSGRSSTAAEGLARLIIGGAGGIKNRNMERFENEKRSEATGLFDRIVNGPGSNQVSTRSAPVSGSVAPPPVSTGPIPDTPASVAADTRSALGMDSIMPASLVQTESGGNFGALNNEMGHGGVAGHGGRAQFGHARLQDAAAAGLIPAGTTPQQFAQMPPATQIAVENWHFGDIDKAIDETGAIGRNINGVQVTRDGLRSVAHLGGIGGMRRYIDSNGQYNPSDSFGTSLSDYAATHSGGGSAAPAQQNTASQAELMQVMSNPWLSNEQKSVLGAMLSQAQQNADPMRQLQLERAQLELENARNPGSAGGEMRVGSQEILADGTIIQSTNQGPRVYSPTGEIVTGQAAADAIAQANAVRVENEQAVYGARREGTLQSDIALGGQAAAVEDIAKASVDTGMDAWSSYGQLQSNIGNIDTAIEAIDNGAQSGIIYNMLPSVTQASASLENAMNRMGLDVVGAVTFGALSEKELRIAMETAVPQNLRPQQLRAWLVEKREAQQKAAAMMADAAQFLTNPENTINDWIAKNREQGANSPQTQRDESGVPTGVPADAWNAMTPEERALWN